MRAIVASVLRSASRKRVCWNDSSSRPKAVALARIGDRPLEHRLDHDDGGDGDRQALLRELLHQLEEALALGVAEQVLGRHAHVVEEQLGGVLAVHADLVEQLAAREPLEVVAGLGDDQRHAGGAVFAAGLRGDDQQVAVLAVGDEGLGAVDHVLVAVALGARLDVLQVRAGTRLGHRDRADELAAGHGRQPAPLLLLAAVVEDVVRDDRAVDAAAECAVGGARLLLEDHGLVGERAAAAAVLLRNRRAQAARPRRPCSRTRGRRASGRPSARGAAPTRGGRTHERSRAGARARRSSTVSGEGRRSASADGASRTRTGGLLGAIQALSQLSYSPVSVASEAGANRSKRRL